MATEYNRPNHRYYQKRYHVKLAVQDICKQFIYASGIKRIDNEVIRVPLFSLSEPGVWYDPSDLTTLFQDPAGTTPVTTPGQTVARVNDKSGRGNHATQSILASRPTYALHPSSGIRNVANGSADVGNTAFWPASPTVTGITATKVASGFDTDGLPYVDVRYQGTATSTFHDGIYISGNSRASAVSGQAWTASCIVQRIGGSTTGVAGIEILSVEETAPSTFVNANSSGVTSSASPVMLSATRTVATGNQVRAAVVLAFTNGATIDITYRIKALQLELGSARTNYQFNYANFNIVEAPFAQLGNLLFDGVDDFMVTPTITPGIDKAQVFAGVRKLSDAAIGAVLETSDNSNNNSGAIWLLAPGSPGSNQYSFRSKGTASSDANVTGYTAPITNVITGIGGIADDASIIRVNGAQVGSSAVDQGTGNYLAYPLYIGRRGGTSLPFNGRLYGLVVRFGPNLDTATIAATEAWMNTKTGAY